MAREARKIEQKKVRQLRQQLEDSDYVQAAIDRLASRMTDKILGLDSSTLQDHRSKKLNRMVDAWLRTDRE